MGFPGRVSQIAERDQDAFSADRSGALSGACDLECVFHELADRACHDDGGRFLDDERDDLLEVQAMYSHVGVTFCDGLAVLFECGFERVERKFSLFLAFADPEAAGDFLWFFGVVGQNECSVADAFAARDDARDSCCDNGHC